MLLYIKITFTRFRNKDQRNTFTNLKYRRPARSDGTKVRKFYQTKNGTPFGVPDMIRKQTTTLSGGRGSGRTRRRARSSVPARRGFAPYARRSRRRRRQHDTIGRPGDVAGPDAVEGARLRALQPLAHLLQKAAADRPPRHAHRALDDLDIRRRRIHVALLESRCGVALLGSHEAGAHLHPLGS